jgi:glutathione peroxidase
MTAKQQFLKIVYPVFAYFTRIFKINKGIFSSDEPAAQSFYSLGAILNHGDEFDFSQLKNKKVLIVNTASDCGYTAQYEELEKLYNLKKDKLEILAFPANDFQKQESKDDNTIAEFCKHNYGISFPLMKKSKVVIHSTQNNVYDWLTDKEKNGWNSNEPSWNFCKYLVNEEGNLTHFFESSEAPMGKNILAAIEE